MEGEEKQGETEKSGDKREGKERNAGDKEKERKEIKKRIEGGMEGERN